MQIPSCQPTPPTTTRTSLNQLTTMMWWLGLSLLLGCSDIELMRDAAQNTTEMNTKMEDMLDQVATSNATTAEMSAKMDAMQAHVDAMSDEVGLMSKMYDHLLTMATTMNSMNLLMLDMNERVTGMQNLLQLTQRQGRQVGANLSRNLAWQSLTDATHKIEAKLTHAAIYYYSFEYQSALLEEINDSNFMSYLLYEGVREYLRTIEPLIREADGNLAIDSKDSRRNALYALSAAMHEYNPLQRVYNSQPITMEQLLKHGLLSAKLNDQDAPEFSKEVHSWIPSVEYLLKLRHNFITGVIVQKISTLDKHAQYHPFDLAELLSKATKALSTWEINYPQVITSPGLIAELTKFTNMANDLREFMFCYSGDGQPPEISFGLKAILAKLNLDPIHELIHERQPAALAGPFITAMHNLKLSVEGNSLSLDNCPSTAAMLKAIPIHYKGITHEPDATFTNFPAN